MERDQLPRNSIAKKPTIVEQVLKKLESNPIKAKMQQQIYQGNAIREHELIEVIENHRQADQAILKVLECPICYEILSVPVTIPCGHSFCLKCITNCFTTPSGKGSDRTHFRVEKCPMCRGPIKLDLIPSIVLRDMVTLLLQNKCQDRAAKIEEDMEFYKRHVCCIRLGAHCTSKMCLRPKFPTNKIQGEQIPDSANNLHSQGNGAAF